MCRGVVVILRKTSVSRGKLLGSLSVALIEVSVRQTACFLAFVKLHELLWADVIWNTDGGHSLIVVN